MGIKFDDRLIRSLLEMERACDELPMIAEQVRAETLGHLILGADANVYSTVQGAYQRTGELKRGLDARVRASRNRVVVEAISASDHAAHVEFGREVVSAAMLQALSLANPNPEKPLSLGRSGVNWAVSGPIVAPAQAFAHHRLRQLFSEKVREAARR